MTPHYNPWAACSEQMRRHHLASVLDVGDYYRRRARQERIQRWATAIACVAAAAGLALWLVLQ